MDNFSKKTVRDLMFGLGMAAKEILSHLFNPFNMKTVPEYMIMIATDICGKSLSQGSEYMGLCENIHF